MFLSWHGKSAAKACRCRRFGLDDNNSPDLLFRVNCSLIVVVWFLEGTIVSIPTWWRILMIIPNVDDGDNTANFRKIIERSVNRKKKVFKYMLQCDSLCFFLEEGKQKFIEIAAMEYLSCQNIMGSEILFILKLQFSNNCRESNSYRNRQILIVPYTNIIFIITNKVLYPL